MRVSFYHRRRTPGMRLAMRAEGKPDVVPPGGVPAEEESSDDELSDGESSDDDLDGESSDEESDDESGSPTPRPTKSKSPSSSTSLGSGSTTTTTTTPSTPPELGTTATPIPNPSTTVAAPVSTPSTTTDSQPAQETGPSSSSLPDLPSTSTLPPQSSALVSSSSIISSATTSPLPVLNPGDLTTPTVELPQSTSGPTNVPQSDNAVNPPGETDGGGSGNSQKAGQIAGGVIGSIAFIALLLLAAWFWRRRRNQNRLSRRMSGLGPDDGSSPYRGPEPRGPGSFRSPSSIMNQLMTAAYAAEDGRMSYRDSREQIYDNYADEKQGFGSMGMHANESTERLAVPAAAQLRPPSIAARTETTNRTESTWKTWGVLAGNPRVSAPRNWWVDRYFRTA